MSYQAHEFTVKNFVRVMGKRATSALMNIAQLVAFYADQNGRRIRMAIETVAELVGRDIRTTQRSMRELEQGWLRCVDRSSGGRPSTYEIAPMVDGLNPGTRAGVESDTDPGIAVPGPRRPRPATPAPASNDAGTGATQSVKNQKEESVGNTQNAHARETGADAHGVCARPRDDGHRSEPDGFDELAMIYPPGTGSDSREKALRAYRAVLRDGHTIPDIHAGARRYAEYIKAKDCERTQFVSHLSNWLREKKFQLSYDPPLAKAEPELETKTRGERVIEEFFRKKEQNDGGSG